MRKTSSSRYQRAIAGFAATAFALLGILSTMQHESNTVTAAASRNAIVMTTYKSSRGCFVRTAKQVNGRILVRPCRYR